MKGIEFFCNTRNAVRSPPSKTAIRSQLEKILHDLRRDSTAATLPQSSAAPTLKGAYECTLTRLALVHRREANALVLMRTCSHSDLW